MVGTPLRMIALLTGLFTGAGCGLLARPTVVDPVTGQQAPVYDCQRDWFGGGETCSPRPVAAPTHSVRRSPVLGAPQAQDTWLRRDGTLQTRTSLTGGQLVARGQPATHPNDALLIWHTTTQLAPAPCSARLFRDGVEIPIHESARNNNYEMRTAIDINTLHQLQTSVRLAADICGHTFELDPTARTTLANFEARFQEERTKQTQPQSKLAEAR